MSEEWDVEGLDETLEYSQIVAASIEAIIQDWLHEFGLKVVYEIKSEIQNRGSIVTGELVATTGILAEEWMSIDIGSTSEHASYWEEGHGPIKPVKALALRFIAKDGKVVFTTYVAPVDGTWVFQNTIEHMLDSADADLPEYIDRKILMLTGQDPSSE